MEETSGRLKSVALAWIELGQTNIVKYPLFRSLMKEKKEQMSLMLTVEEEEAICQNLADLTFKDDRVDLIC